MTRAIGNVKTQPESHILLYVRSFVTIDVKRCCVQNIVHIHIHTHTQNTNKPHTHTHTIPYPPTPATRPIFSLARTHLQSETTHHAREWG